MILLLSLYLWYWSSLIRVLLTTILCATNLVTVHGKILVGEKLANYEYFTKIFLATVHRYTENVFGICTDLLIRQIFPCFAKTFSHQNFPVCIANNGTVE